SPFRKAVAALPGIIGIGIGIGSAAAQDNASPPLPPLPQVLYTVEHPIRVVALTTELENPWSLAFLPGGDMLVTERPGRLRVVRDGRLVAEPVAGVPAVRMTILGGLLDVALHPDFADNGWVYLSYSKPRAEGSDEATTALARGRFDGERLLDVEDVFVANSWSASPFNFGGRVAFDRDGFLYLAVG